MTPHIEANKEDIAKIVIMPGDPKRATFIAENYLKDYKLVNEVRKIYAYTGYYNKTKVTVMASGMGIPSMGIYAYELFKVYDVDKIIRIGSCGAYLEKLNLFDIILSDMVYSESNFALSLNNDNCHLIKASEKLNNKIIETAKKNNIKLVVGNTICNEAFDSYMTDINKFFERIPKDLNIIAAEMEAFALFYIAKMLNKQASCLMSVVDLPCADIAATPKDREQGLRTMIDLALKSIEEGD